MDGIESNKFKNRVKPAKEVCVWAQARSVTDDYQAIVTEGDVLKISNLMIGLEEDASKFRWYDVRTPNIL